MVPGEDMLGARRRGFRGALTHGCCGQGAWRCVVRRSVFASSLLPGLVAWLAGLGMSGWTFPIRLRPARRSPEGVCGPNLPRESQVWAVLVFSWRPLLLGVSIIAAHVGHFGPLNRGRLTPCVFPSEYRARCPALLTVLNVLTRSTAKVLQLNGDAGERCHVTGEDTLFPRACCIVMERKPMRKK